MNKLKKKIKTLFLTLFVVLIAGAGMIVTVLASEDVPTSTVSITDIPPFSGSAITIIKNNVPDFYVGEITPDPYVRFSPLDALGRTGPGMACLGSETMPTEPRGEIGDIRPSGFQTARYDDLIEDRYLFNRCHVIGYQLCGDNATPENLFTGTRYLNTDSMLLFEDKVAGYLNAHAGNHVIYRVTPQYEGDNLVASGVEMEAFSVEDFGKELSFHVFVYNIQPGITINYATGDSWVDPTYAAGAIRGAAQVLSEGATGPESFVITQDAVSDAGAVREVPQAEETPVPAVTEEVPQQISYILNTNTKKFHYPGCSSVQDMKEKNKEEFYGSREEAIARGFVPCGRCNP